VADRLLPSVVVAVTVAVPTAMAVISPLDETMTTEVSLLDQVTVLLEVSDGLTVAVSCEVSPAYRLTLLLLSVMPEAFLGVTVTIQLADRLLPSVVVAVIVAVSTATAVTIPFSSTVATEVLLLDQVTALLAASVGMIVAVSWEDVPASMLMLLLLSAMPVAFLGVVVTIQLADRLLPSVVVAVIVAVPTATAVTTPFSSTVAMFTLSLLQLTVVVETPSGVKMAVSVVVLPTSTEVDVLSNVIPVAIVIGRIVEKLLQYAVDL